MPWKRQVSPAQRRVHATHRGKGSFLYLVDMHRVDWGSACSACPLSDAPPTATGFIEAAKRDVNTHTEVRDFGTNLRLLFLYLFRIDTGHE